LIIIIIIIIIIITTTTTTIITTTTTICINNRVTTEMTLLVMFYLSKPNIHISSELLLLFAIGIFEPLHLFLLPENLKIPNKSLSQRHMPHFHFRRCQIRHHKATKFLLDCCRNIT